MPSVDVAAVVDTDGAKRRMTVATHPELKSYSTLTAALRAAEFDFACLAAPGPALPSLADEALDAGLAVLVEKPMASTEEEAIEIIRKAERLGLLLAVGHVERFNPAVQALKQRLSDGALGRIYQLHARRISPFPGFERASILGVTLDLAPHDIDVMRYVTGSEVERVYAEMAQQVHDSTEDLICASLRLDDGATGLLEVNWLTPTQIRQISITGEGGMFVVDYLRQELFFHENPPPIPGTGERSYVSEGNMTRFAIKRKEPLRVEWERFLEALETGGEAAVDGYEGLAALSIARAIRLSGETHDVVVPSYRALAPR